jgi:alkylated DNA repair dioxygenase AlkB
MQPPTHYHPAFVPDPAALFATLRDEVVWDQRMKARRTASMGEPYNYSQMDYPRAPWHPLVSALLSGLAPHVGAAPTNCLLNLYPSGASTMGWHADDISALAPGTGIAIVSLGAARPLLFRRRDGGVGHDVIEQVLEAGSLLVMSGAMQQEWQHSLPAAPSAGERMSLTFRCL